MSLTTNVVFKGAQECVMVGVDELRGDYESVHILPANVYSSPIQGLPCLLNQNSLGSPFLDAATSVISCA